MNKLRSLVILILAWPVMSQNCIKVIGGPRGAGHSCAFPFLFSGKLYTRCTSDSDPDGREWCSLLTYENRTHIGGRNYWGYCGEPCDEEATTTTTAPTTTTTTTTTTSTTTTRTALVGGRRSSDSTRGDWLPDSDKFECGANIDGGSQIVKGRKATLGQFPFMALLGFWKRNNWEFGCGGTLINRRYVVTAAHCHQRPNGQNFDKQIAQVVIGDLILGQEIDAQGAKPPQRFFPKDKDIMIHEDWNFNSFNTKGNDIALIRLDRLVVTVQEDTDQRVMPICLPWKETVDDSEWRQAFVAGWGKTTQIRLDRGDFEEARAFSKNQQYAQVDLVNVATCRRENEDFRRLSFDNHICARGRNGEDSCQGDSGGPLFVQKLTDLESRRRHNPYFLRGIVSFGTNPCGVGVSGVYTNVNAFIPWIIRNLRP